MEEAREQIPGLTASVREMDLVTIPGTEQALVQVNQLINQQAFTRAADDIFLGSAGIFLSLIALIWLTRRPASAAGSAGAGGAH